MRTRQNSLPALSARRTACGAAVMALLLSACASHRPIPPLNVPPTLAVSGGQVLTLAAHGAGVQIYECRPQKDAPSVFSWTLKSPEADLLDRAGLNIGHHYAGPTWESTDGSKVVGEVVSREESPKAGAIPWLLLRATSNTGKRKTVFRKTQSIQRLNTIGGLAPTSACDASQTGRRERVAYSADYYFYAGRK